MKYFSPTIIASLLCVILFYTGIVTPRSSKPFNTLLENSDIEVLSGKVVSNPVKSSSGKTYSVIFSPSYGFAKSGFSGSTSGEVSLYVPSEIVEAYYPGKLNTIAKPRKTTETRTELFKVDKEKLHGFDSQFPIIENGISLVSKVSYLERDDGAPAFYVEEVVSHGYKSKLDFYRACSRLMLKRILYNWGECGGLLLALLSGAREYTSEEVQKSFSNAGLAHVLALSGMHLSIFASLPNKFSKKKIPLISLIVVMVFVWFAGLSPSLLRALLCMILGLILKKLGVETNLLGILSLSFLIQISIFPSHIYNYGFILSYCALIGLDLGQKLFLPFFCKLFPKKFSSDISSSLGAQFITSPICLLGFGTCSPFGVIASVVVSPLASIFLSFGIFALILSLFIPFLLSPFGCIMSMFYAILTWIVGFFAKFPIIQISI